MKLTKEFLEKTRDPDDGSFLFDNQIKQILQDQKLRELVDERIEILSRPDAPDSRVVKVVLNVCEKLLEDCKK